MKVNLRGWRSEADFKRYGRTLGFQIREQSKDLDSSALRKAIAAFKRDPEDFLAYHGHINFYAQSGGIRMDMAKWARAEEEANKVRPKFGPRRPSRHAR